MYTYLLAVFYEYLSTKCRIQTRCEKHKLKITRIKINLKEFLQEQKLHQKEETGHTSKPDSSVHKFHHMIKMLFKAVSLAAFTFLVWFYRRSNGVHALGVNIYCYIRFRLMSTDGKR